MIGSEAGHVILEVQSFSLDVFTKQMMLNDKNMWAVLDYFVKLMGKQENGHYVFLKDPMKGIVRIYKVPEEEVQKLEEEQEYDSSEYSEYSEYSGSEEGEYSEEEEEEEE